jgi:hypothetical protein
MLNGIKKDSTRTDINGHYQFSNVHQGLYNIVANTHKPWNGVNATDAVKIKMHYAGQELFTSSIRLHAADVNMSFGINVTDAVKVTRRFIGSDTSFIIGDWLFAKPIGGDTLTVSVYKNDTVIVSNHNIQQDFIGLCAGDVNGSNFPNTGAKNESKVHLSSAETIGLCKNDEIDVPVIADSEMEISAMSMILNFPENLIKIMDCRLSQELSSSDLYFFIKGNELRISWFEDYAHVKLNKDDILLYLRIKVFENFKPGEIINFKVKNDRLCEFADVNGNPVDNMDLKSFSIRYTDSHNQGISVSELPEKVYIYPNPSGGRFTIKATGKILQVVVLNMMGETIEKRTVTKNDDLSFQLNGNGVYFIKVVTEERDFYKKIQITNYK